MRDWTSEQFFDSADDYYEVMFEYFRKSRSTIDFEVYIFEKSKMGDLLLHELTQAARRGVQVRLLVDGVGSLKFAESYGSNHKGVAVKIYHPVPWKKWTTKNTQISTGWRPTTFFQLFASMNSRNHRKVCVIDDEHAFIGSYNVTDVHSKKYSHEKAWRDYGVRVSGKCVQLLSFGFKKAWFNSLRENIKIQNLKTSKDLKKYCRYFLLNHSLRSRLAGRHRILSRIDSAQSRIWLVTPYFIPTIRVIRNLKAAAERGVDVRLLLPLNNDVIFMHSVMRTYYGVLIRSGVKIYEYKPTMHHAKVAVIDTWCALGSMNMNSRSIIHDLEANYIMHTEVEKKKVIAAIEYDFSQSILIDKSNFSPWYQRWFGQILLIFKYWI